ncbi:MAG: hypothetical protein ACQEWV_15675 [Bacillota bacterium]
MGTNDNQEQELQLKQVTRNFIQKQLEQLKNTKKDNNSFIHLESDTLNLLIGYLLLKIETQNNDKTTNKIENDLFPDELIEELDSVIMNSKTGLEEILNLLKKEK